MDTEFLVVKVEPLTLDFNGGDTLHLFVRDEYKSPTTCFTAVGVGPASTSLPLYEYSV